jgi:hypothetical protein
MFMPRTGAKNVKVSFTAGHLTHFGGVHLMHQFLQQILLRTFLGRALYLPERNNHFTVTERLLAMMYPMILGLNTMELKALLGTNGVFQYLTGLPKVPHHETLRQFLVKNAPVLHPKLHAVHNDLRAHFLLLPHPLTSLWFDFDSTARTLYGHQEGAMKGYNPHKKGARSYHPLLCAEAHLGDCLGGVLRYGNAGSATGVLEMLDEMLLLIPTGVRELRARADAGFFERNFIEKLDKNRFGFAVVADLTIPIQHRLLGLRYHRISAWKSAAEFRYQPDGWPRAHRFVVVRERLTEPRSRQLKLLKLDRYAYRVIVTNLDLTPFGVFNFYDGRVGLERIIRVLRDDFPYAKAATQWFLANAMYAEESLLAYNLMTWFQRLCLPDDWQSYTAATLRQRLMLIPGVFTRTGNRPELKLPRNNPYQDTFTYAMRKIKQVKPLV